MGMAPLLGAEHVAQAVVVWKVKTAVCLIGRLSRTVVHESVNSIADCNLWIYKLPTVEHLALKWLRIKTRT